MPSGFAITAIVIMIVLGLIVVIQMIAITALLLVLKNIAQEIRERVDPLLAKVNSLLITANDMAQTVQGKTEHIADRATQTSDVVATGIERTTHLLQRVIAAPIIGGSAFSAGVARGLQAWRSARRRHATASPCDENLFTTSESPTTGDE